MKLIIKSLAALAVLLVIGLFIGVWQIDRLARTAVERGSTHALGVRTTLESASIGLRMGEFELQGLEVSNPEGFDSPHFLTLASGQGSVTLGSLRDDIVELPLLELEDVDVHLEKQGGRSNYKVILENLERFESPGGREAGKEGKKFIIRRIEIRNVLVHADLLPIGGGATKVDVEIDVISLEDVGSGSEDGVYVAELAAIVMKAIFAAVLAKGGQLPGEILAEVGQALAGLGDLGQFGIEVVGKVGEALGDVIEDLGKGVEDILGGKKQD